MYPNDGIRLILRAIGHVSTDRDAVALLDLILAAHFGVRGTVLTDDFNLIRR